MPIKRSTKEEDSLYYWSNQLEKTRKKALAGTLVAGGGACVDHLANENIRNAYKAALSFLPQKRSVE